MEGYDYYQAAASTIKIDDIAGDDVNRMILRRLKANDPQFDNLRVGNLWVYEGRSSSHRGNIYCPEGVRNLGWLGYYIGQNTILRELKLQQLGVYFSGSNTRPFFKWVNQNRFIQEIKFYRINLFAGDIFQSLRPFFENNNNLSELEVYGCNFGVGSERQLSLAIQACGKISLKSVRLSNSQLGEAPLVDIIQSLSMHPQLEKLGLISMNAGRKECTKALTNLLRSTTTRLEELNLCNNDIGDEGLDALVGGLTNSRLNVLNLSSNHNITARGCQSLASFLDNPNSSLEMLVLCNNNIGDEGAHIVAISLANNRKLKTLYLSKNGITAEGYSSFSEILCDTTSVNSTFLSNHTLERFGDLPSSSLPVDVRSLLKMNRGTENKKQVAMKKILNHHQHFYMQPFFEWDLKVLPHAVSWFERARSVDSNVVGIDRHKLEAIYQFIRAMPEVFEPVPAAAGEKRKRSRN